MLLYTYLTSYDVNPVREKELSFPKQNDEGDPRDVAENLRCHADDEENTLERVFIDITESHN